VIVSTRPKRIMKARKRSTCSICVRSMTVGQSIAYLPDRLPGQRWVHLRCITEVTVRRAVRDDTDDRHPVP
jgi:hypothetical protein